MYSFEALVGGADVQYDSSFPGALAVGKWRMGELVSNEGAVATVMRIIIGTLASLLVVSLLLSADILSFFLATLKRTIIILEKSVAEREKQVTILTRYGYYIVVVSSLLRSEETMRELRLLVLRSFIARHDPEDKQTCQYARAFEILCWHKVCVNLFYVVLFLLSIRFLSCWSVT
jgi:hypothetical protein